MPDQTNELTDERNARHQPRSKLQIERTLSLFVGIAICLWAAFISSAPSRHNVTVPYLGIDDFFYYLKIAQNIATGHGSTFNGIVRTNGYHPLWELCLVAAEWVTQRFGTLRGFLELAVFGATMATYLFTYRLLRRGGLGAVGAALGSAYLAAYSAHLFIYSMEVTLAVPLMLALLLVVQEDDRWLLPGMWGYVCATGVGLLVSAVVLSRLDTAIFVALLGLGFLVERETRRRLSPAALLGLATGILPVAGYFAFNHAVYGVWEPVSGMAKQLKLHHGFTAQAWSSLLHKSPVALLNLLPVIAALAVLPLYWKRMRPVHRAMAAAALTFPFVYITALSWASDWQLWDWYYYSFRPALCVALLVLSYSARVRLVMTSRIALAVTAVFVLVFVARTSWPMGASDTIQEGLALQPFIQSHPGIYAMGDRSGVVGYLTDQPIMQTEGLVMDKAFLHTIKQQTPLRQVLESYHVRYYIGNATKPFTGCFEAVEPYQAGAAAPHMRGEFCEVPVATWTIEGVRTMVFDLHPQQ